MNILILMYLCAIRIGRGLFVNTTTSVIRNIYLFCRLAKAGLSLVVFFSPLAQAVLPNAGQAIRDLEDTRLSLPPPVKLQSPAPPKDRTSASEDHTTRVWVAGFRISGNQAISSEQLLSLLNDLAGRQLSLAQLQEAGLRVTTYYRQRGFVLAHAYLPKQEISGGQVRIEVTEGRYGEIRMYNASHVLSDILQGPISGLKSGEIVSGGQLERSLLLLSDIPGATVKSTLMPGSRYGTTDLQIDATPSPWLSGSLQADNYGDTYTGEYRGAGSLSVNSPLRLGDRLDLRLLSSDQHQRYYRAAYQLPLGPWSTRTGVAHSQMSYRLGKDFSDLQAHGDASINSAFIAQPLLRSRTANINAQLQFEDKRLRDDIDAFSSRSRKHVALWTAEISANAQDRLFGGGQSAMSLAYGIGSLNIEDPYARQWDRLTADTAGQFSKVTFSVLRLQNLSDHFQMYAQLNGQWTPGNLDSSEKFSIGGPYGVRAFSPGSGNGDLGWQSSLELRYAIRPGWQLSTFIDQGQAQRNKQPWTTEKNTVHMAAAGGALAWGGLSHQVSLTAAWPLARSGADSNMEKSPRIWIQAARYF